MPALSSVINWVLPVKLFLANHDVGPINPESGTLRKNRGNHLPYTNKLSHVVEQFMNTDQMLHLWLVSLKAGHVHRANGDSNPEAMILSWAYTYVNTGHLSSESWLGTKCKEKVVMCRFHPRVTSSIPICHIIGYTKKFISPVFTWKYPVAQSNMDHLISYRQSHILFHLPSSCNRCPKRNFHLEVFTL